MIQIKKHFEFYPSTYRLRLQDYTSYPLSIWKLLKKVGPDLRLCQFHKKICKLTIILMEGRMCDMYQLTSHISLIRTSIRSPEEANYYINYGYWIDIFVRTCHLTQGDRVISSCVQYNGQWTRYQKIKMSVYSDMISSSVDWVGF